MGALERTADEICDHSRRGEVRRAQSVSLAVFVWTKDILGWTVGHRVRGAGWSHLRPAFCANQLRLARLCSQLRGPREAGIGEEDPVPSIVIVSAGQGANAKLCSRGDDRQRYAGRK